MGSPLIVTDAAGREPMVVITLQAFERLSEVASGQKSIKSIKSAMSAQEEPTVTEFASMPAPEPAPAKTESPSLLREIAIQVMDSPEMAEESEISLEERFYLEPMGEETK